MNVFIINQLCVFVKMEEQLFLMDILNCFLNFLNSFKELRCNYCSEVVEVLIKLRGLYDGFY